MVFFRWIVLLMLLVTVLNLAVYLITRQPVWRQRAVLMLRWTVVVGLGFFALLILRRAAVFI